MRVAFWLCTVPALFACATSARARDCAGDADLCTTPYHIGAIADIVIENWKSAGRDRRSDCKAKRPFTVEVVREYLSAAGRISGHEAIVTQYYPKCSAKGRMTAGKGRHGIWDIGSDFGGSLIWSDTRGVVHLFLRSPGLQGCE